MKYRGRRPEPKRPGRDRVTERTVATKTSEIPVKLEHAKKMLSSDLMSKAISESCEMSKSAASESLAD